MAKAGVKVKLNMNRIMTKVRKKFMGRRYRDQALKKAERHFKKTHAKLIEEFEKHPVTQELKQGPFGGNPSRTLGGYGNLYSFIGFHGEDPTAIVSAVLKSDTKIDRRTGAAKKKGKNMMEYNFKVTLPNMGTLESMTPMPWENGRSWLRGIERGISGFGFYMNKMGGRSGGGFQSYNQVRAGGFRNVKYLTEIFSNFKKNLKTKAEK
jgi:hypothetical protein